MSPPGPRGGLRISRPHIPDLIAAAPAGGAVARLDPHHMLDRLRSWLGLAERKSYPTSGVDRPAAWLLDMLGGSPTTAGIAVSPESAMRVPAVVAAVRSIAETAGSLPLILYRRMDGGGKERAVDHPAYRLVHDEPNPWTSPIDLFAELVVGAFQHGRAYAHVLRVGDEPRELALLPHGTVTRDQPDPLASPVYKLRLASGGAIELGTDRVLELSLFGGRSLIASGAEAIATHAALQKHVASIMGRGGRPSGVLQRKDPIAPAQWQQAMEQLQAAMGGLDNAGKTMLLPPGTEWKATTFSSVDLATVDLWRQSRLEIAALFRVPPHMLGDLERATHANAESLSLQFLTYTLRPVLDALEGACNRSLLSADERRTHFFEFVTDDLVKADTAARAEAFSKLISARVVSPNEARATGWNLPPYEGGDEYANPNIDQKPAASGNGSK